MKFTHISPTAEKKSSLIEGTGLFAKNTIKKDEIVAVKGGHIFDGKSLKEIEKKLGPAEVQVADDLFIGPVAEHDREGAMLHLNHSCEPNVGVQGQIVFVAMQEIGAGEELTFDYAMTDDEDYEMECNCKAASCRKTITGRDWRSKDLQNKYGKYFSWYLLQKM